MAALLECKHLCKSFDRRVVLDDVNLKIDKGKIALTGSADKLRAKEKSSIDELFRRMFYAKKAR